MTPLTAVLAFFAASVFAEWDDQPLLDNIEYPGNASLDLAKRQSGYIAAVVEITFYSFIDSTTADGGDCAANCRDYPTPPFPNPEQGIVAHTCSNPDGSPRTDSNGSPTAGGDGTYNNPISAAAATGLSIIDQCQPFWMPYLSKWFIYDDDCPSCNDDAAHFDSEEGQQLILRICDCENALTPINGAQYNANNGGAACIFYNIDSPDLTFIYQPSQTGALYQGGTCAPDPGPSASLNTIESSDPEETGSLCEVCLVNTNTGSCQAGDTATIVDPFRKRTAPTHAVTRRAELAQGYTLSKPTATPEPCGLTTQTVMFKA